MIKTFFRLIVFSLLITFYACDKEELLDDSVDKNTIENNNYKVSYEGISNETGTKKSRMEWISFIAAQAILSNEDAKSRFITILGNSNKNKRVALEDLLGHDNAFRSEFVSVYDYYLKDYTQNCVRVIGGLPQPDRDMDWDNTYESHLVNTILKDDNFELYLPNGYYASISRITSSLVKSTVGYRHVERCDITEIKILPNKPPLGNVIITRDSY